MRKNKNIYAHGSMLLALAAALLFTPLGLMAQEEDAPAEGNGTTGQLKPAIALGAPFVDNAILQRELPVPVWGWSKPGTKITVAFSGQKITAEAGKNGKWMLKLKPLKASAEPAEMTISDSEGKTVVLKNVLVGEVWMASGQSNMQWKPVKCDVGLLLKRIADSVKAGNEKQPVIREYEVTSVYSALHPVERATGAWKDGNFQEYSAIAFAFAYELYKELGVPIGIVNCSFSMTSVRAWTPRCGFKDGKDEQTQAIYKSLMETDPSAPEHKVAWAKYYKDVEDTITANAELVKGGNPAEAISTKTPGNMDGNRDATWMYNARMHPVVPYAIRGAIWNQCYSSMFEGIHYYHRLHSLIRGWREMWAAPKLPVYFHQLYAPGANDGLSLNDMGEMRLGFWLARDIPNVGMACQIDITGDIHYSDKALPGKRLALHALKNQYPSTTLRAGGKAKDIVADGPMFKSYEVKGDKLTVTLDFAEGGLLVGKAIRGQTMDGPVTITNGEEQVTLFYLADKDRVWHRAKMKIASENVELSASGVTEPRGVAYGCNGIGDLPNLYNRAMLPLAPFITYDHKLVSSKPMSPDIQAWPDSPIKVAGVEVDLSTVGLKYEYRKMPLLSNQFRDNAVLQAGQPIVIRGSALHDSGVEATGKAEITFSFAPSTGSGQAPSTGSTGSQQAGSGQAGIEQTIPVTPGMKEWQVTVPAMEASAEPKTLNVTFTIDGELAHERVCTNIVIGDVWYIAAPGGVIGSPAAKPDSAVRMMTRKSKEERASRPRRFNVSTSNSPDSRFASVWEPADGFAAALGQRLKARTGRPVGIVLMQSSAGKGVVEPALKSWIDWEYLDRTPSLMADYEQLAGLRPGTKYYEANVRRYVDAWKRYWGEYIPALMNTKAVPDGIAWGTYPTLGGAVTTEASQVYNVMVSPFTPGSFRGIIFLANQQMVADDEGPYFGEQMSALANCWKEKFGCEDPQFIYTVPGKTLAPKITPPGKIKGRSTGVEISSWSDWDKVIEAAVSGAGE